MKAKLLKLRCKDTVKKLPKIILPKKGKKAKYNRKKNKDISEHQDE
jgi:hypothetical protein